MFFWKILIWIWPFLWEMIVGKQSLMQAMRSNKRKVIIVVLVAMSVSGNAWLIGKVVVLSHLVMDLRKQGPTKERVIKPPTPDFPQGVVAREEKTEATPSENVPDRYTDIKNRFEEIEAHEKELFRPRTK